MMAHENEVLFEEMQGKGGNLGIITLNRPAVLNALSYSMVIAMYQQLQQWANNTLIKAVVIRAVPGRAFCAGGDIRASYEAAIQPRDFKASDFFRDEYILNRLIYHYPKPYIAFLDGITMGGGAGISIHGSHRIGTDHLLFAMPETGIGFFPDVGATYFLPRLPHSIGFYLGLTGARIKIDDGVGLGLINYQVAPQDLSVLLHALAEKKFSKDLNVSVSEVIEGFAKKTSASVLMQEGAAIQTCFSLDSMEAIIQALQVSPSPICQDAATQLAKKSPTSLKVTLRALQEGRQLEFDACMQQEFCLAWHFLQSHDLKEGIRAVVIDKDQTPHWKPASLNQVNEAMVDHFFSPVTEDCERR